MGPLFIQTNREGDTLFLPHGVLSLCRKVIIHLKHRMTLSNRQLRRSEYVNGTKLAHLYLKTPEKQYKRKCIESYVMCFLKTSAFDM